MANRIVIAAALLAAPIAALSGCSTSDQADEQTTSSSAAPAGTERLTAQLKTADGTPVANATLDFANGFARVTVETIESGILSPGFHGMHIHSVGKCEASSVAPTGGEPGDFLSAGGHFQAPGHTGHPASGDLTALEVRSDGSAELVTTTDAFTAQDLLAGEGTALMIHQDEDNFGHIPDRYSQGDGSPGPDQDTLATGDAGGRVACGVIESVSATTSSSTTTTTTTTTTTPTTITETTVISPTTIVPPPVTQTTTPATTTVTTATTTTTVPTETTTEPPPPPGQG
ncbi:superoxide dismutase[Cu-Zn] [Mycobacterium deserti]|uniref:Superoxide dismutase [Cu-Zn] n=1 Tax=Mycobacterium deserti TaxID=2978347 RepID=A0ABT2MFG3_9MYCO|nr:superoxide dismutase family protein [Mycobacterium deserti]MCT7661018.1 superoxide dismutase family protein [Mycobacterium deserti]